MTWSDSLSVGVKAMDDQHRVLVGILNDLHTAMLAGKAHTITGELLHKLVEYTKFHFACEEELMQEAGFAGLAAHHQRHQELTREVELFVGRYQRGEEMLNIHLMNFLRDWLSHHILEEDREYGTWINRKKIG
jgi:hemerythrin-like metal-binding protein